MLLKLRSLFQRIDWRVEAAHCLLARDWRNFIFCLREDPELLQYEIQFVGQPFLFSILSRDIQVVSSVLGLGADPNAECSAQIFTYLLSDQENFAISERMRVPRYPGYDLPPMNALTIAWMIGEPALHNELLSHVSPATRMKALTWSLLLGDQSWLSRFDLREIESLPANNGFTPVFASLFGGCSPELFSQLWQASPEEHRRRNYGVSTAPPGFEEGNHDIVSGDLQFWARQLGRSELIALMR